MSLCVHISSVLSVNIASLVPAASRALQHLRALPLATGEGARNFSSAGPVATRSPLASLARQPPAVPHNSARLHNDGPTLLRGFSASACSAAELSLNEVVTQVQKCAAQHATQSTETTETTVLSSLADDAMARVKELTPEQIRNLAVSFAQLGYFNTQFKSCMADAVIQKLDQFEPSMLADTAWAFGEANYYDFELMSHLMAYLKSNIQSFEASDMAKMLWTFARFGYQDEALINLMHDIALKLQANCNSQSLAEVVYAMAQLGWADMRLHSLVAEYAMDNIRDFDSHSLAKLAYGLASVGYDDHALYSAITEQAAANLDTMSPHEVSMILWACGEQGHLCDKFMTAVVNTYMPDNIASFTPQQLQIAVKAWNKLGFTNPAVAATAVRLDKVLPHLAEKPAGSGMAAAGST